MANSLKPINMKLYKIFFLIAAAALSSCKDKAGESGGFKVSISPDAGSTVKLGTSVTVKVSYAAELKPDSVVYLIDSAHLAVKKDSLAVTLKTDTLKLGVKTLTVKVYSGGKDEDAATNIVVVAPRAPQELTYKVDKIFPHDTSSYTEGLIYQNGFFYESDGGRAADIEGQSSLRKTNINGKVLQIVNNNPKIFAEGIAIVGNKIIQLTWTERIGYVYDLNTFKLLTTFTNNVGLEGWGMCSDGTKLYMDDSSNRIWFLDKNTYKAIGHIDVYDEKGPVKQINELEYIDGKIYANVYGTDTIVVINPKNGAVTQRINMSTLYPQPRQQGADVLNGIAWDEKGKRLFVTGKKWPHLYQISAK